MSARSGFGRALVLAAVGAGATALVLDLKGPGPLAARALTATWALLAAAWAPLCAPRHPGATTAAATLAGLGAALALGAVEPLRAGALLVAALGVARGAWLLPGAPARVVLREATLLAGALALAAALGGGSAPVAATWGVGLAQAAVFAWPEAGPARRGDASDDAFERAAARLRALLGAEAPPRA